MQLAMASHDCRARDELFRFSFILLAEDTPIKVNFNSQLPALSVFGLAIPLMSAAIVEAYFAAGLKQFRGFDKDKNEVEIQMDPHDPK